MTSILDLDMIDEDLTDFPDLQSNQMGDFLDDPTQHYDSGISTPYPMDMTPCRTTHSRQSPQRGADGSISSSSYPLARLGSQVPSLSHSPTATNSKNNSCPGTAAFPAHTDSGPASLAHTPTSLYNADSGFPFPTSTTDPSSSICPSLIQTPTQTTNACPSGPNTVINLPRGFEWPNMPSFPPSAGPETPGRSGARTTIVLEDAKPDTIMEVMKVIMKSNAKVTFETS